MNAWVSDLTRCVIYIEEQEGTAGWYEAQLPLQREPSSVVRAFKTLWFPSNRKGEVTDEDFELLTLHGHIGEGRLQEAKDFLLSEPDSGKTERN